MGKHGVRDALRTQLPYWEFISGVSMAMDGTSQQVILPTTATTVFISAEGGAVYYTINGLIAGPTSPGYIPDGGSHSIGPLSSLVSLYVYGAAAVTAHIQFFQER